MDRADLEPQGDYITDAWWTCHKDTKEGDLALLYRAKNRKDIAYLIQARSNAYSLRNDPRAQPGWAYGCDFEVLEKFPRTLTLKEMRDDPALQDWSALKIKFQGKAHRVSKELWQYLLRRLSARPERVEQQRKERILLIRQEIEIEDDLANDAGRLARHARLDLEFIKRQHFCGNGGIADLIYYDRNDKRYVVVELKRGVVGRNAAGQILSYRASAIEDFPANKPPLGILIGTRMDSQAKGVIKYDDNLRFIGLRDIGIQLADHG